MKLLDILRKCNGLTQIRIEEYCDSSTVYARGVKDTMELTELVKSYADYCRLVDREVRKINVFNNVLVLEV